MRALVVVVAVTASVCLAGYWEFEQVDSGSIGSYVAIDKTSDGTIWLAYLTRDSAIRLAHKDTVWEYEDLDTAFVRPPFSFDIGPGDVIGVVGSGRLAERRDSVWSSEQLPMPMSGVAFSYDLAGRPSLMFKDSLGNVCLGQRTDSGWDTSLVIPPDSNYSDWWITFTRPTWCWNGNCAFMESDDGVMGGFFDFYNVSLYTRDSGVWTSDTEAGGIHGGGGVLAALAADGSDYIHTFWSAMDPVNDKLVCDGVRLDSVTSIGAACMNNPAGVQCVWARAGRIKFAMLGGETSVVRDSVSPGRCDITTDTFNEPVIAYSDHGAIWIAHGMGILGLSDAPRELGVRSLPRTPSVVRNVLFVPRAENGDSPSERLRPTRRGTVPIFRAVLLDAAGRKVAELHSGANDVSRLAPGVYFVRERGEMSSEQEDVRRIVVVK
ncbi:MAG TPA: hypothetical protein VMH22_13845 [bacterium]|nr:hypothetical protein [bacterium]